MARKSMRWKTWNSVNILVLVAILCVGIQCQILMESDQRPLDGAQEASREKDVSKEDETTLEFSTKMSAITEIPRSSLETNRTSKEKLPINIVPPTAILPNVIPLPPISEIGEIMAQNDAAGSNQSVEDVSKPEATPPPSNEPEVLATMPELPPRPATDASGALTLVENTSQATSALLAASEEPNSSILEPSGLSTGVAAAQQTPQASQDQAQPSPQISQAAQGIVQPPQSTGSDPIVPSVPISDINVPQNLAPVIPDLGAPPTNFVEKSFESNEVVETSSEERPENALKPSKVSPDGQIIETSKVGLTVKQQGPQTPTQGAQNSLEDVKQVNQELVNIPEDLMALLREQNQQQLLKLAENATEVPKLAKEELESRRATLEPVPEDKKHRLRLEALSIDECRPKLDLVFLLDTSGSIEQIYKEHVKWAVALVDSLPLEPDAVRVAAVQYAGFPLTEFALGTYPSAEDIRAHLERIKFQSGATRTGYALRKAELELFREDRGARQDAVKVIILFTDGLSVDDPSKPAQQLRDIKGVKIYVVNIGNDNFENEMMKIAGKQENIFGPNDLQRLREAVLNDAERARGCSRVGPKILERPPVKKFSTEPTPPPVLHPLSAFEIDTKALEEGREVNVNETEVLEGSTPSLGQERMTPAPENGAVPPVEGSSDVLGPSKPDNASSIHAETPNKVPETPQAQPEGVPLKISLPLQETPASGPLQAAESSNASSFQASQTKKASENIQKSSEQPQKAQATAQNPSTTAQEQPNLLVKLSTPQEALKSSPKEGKSVDKVSKEEPIKLKKKLRSLRPRTTTTQTPTSIPTKSTEKTSRTTRKRRIRTTTLAASTTTAVPTTTRKARLFRQRTKAKASQESPKTSPRQEASKLTTFDSSSRPLILESHNMFPRPNEVKVKSNRLSINDEKTAKTTKISRTTTTKAPTTTKQASTSRFKPKPPRPSKLQALENTNRDAFDMTSAERARFKATSPAPATEARMLTTSKFRRRIRTTTVSELELQKVEEEKATKRSFFRRGSTGSVQTRSSTPLATTTRRATPTPRPARRRLFGANIQNGSDKTICPMDILFIVDSSGSVQTIYDDQKRFLYDLLSVIEIGEKAHRVAVLQFAGNKMHKTEWPYDAYNNTMELLNAFNNSLRLITGTTYIGSALNSAVRVLENRRRDVPNIVLLLSDGFSQDDASFPATEIRRLASNQFYAVSISELSNRDYLANLVGAPDRVFVGSESEDLKNTIIDKLKCRA